MNTTASQVAYTMAAAMSALHVSRATLYELINKQKLRTYKIGRRRYCTHNALMEMQRDLEKETAA